MRKMILLVALLAVVLVGCVSSRELTSPPQDFGSLGEVRGDDAHPGKQPRLLTERQERKLNKLLDKRAQREKAGAWHGKAMEAIAEGKVIAPPQAISEGAYPVLFVNDCRYENRSFMYWQGEDGKRNRAKVPCQSQVVQYLRAGKYWYSVYDYRGKRIWLKNEKGQEGWSLTVDVQTTPCFQENGSEYFERVYTS